MRTADTSLIEQKALALVESGNMAEAEPLLAELVRTEGHDPRHRLNWAFSLIECERYTDALGELGYLPTTFAQQPMVALARGMALFGLSRFSEAAKEFEFAYQRSPELTTAGIFQVRALLLCADRTGGELALEKIPLHCTLAQEDACQLANCLIDVGRYDEATEVLERALQAAPHHEGCLTALAQVYERENKLELAQAVLGRVSDQPTAARLLSARLLARSGHAEQALSQLRLMRSEPRPLSKISERAEIEYAIGKWADHIGDYQEAWAAFTAGNQIDRSIHQSVFADFWDRDISTESLRDPGFVTPDWLSLRAQAEIEKDRSEPSPIFLVGFPRSGTTLLDNMLDAQPSLRVLEEKPVLEPIQECLARRHDGFPAALATLNDGDIAALRQRYWRSVYKYVEASPGQRIIDKFPLNLLRVPLILTLFPDAQWIFAVRHPLDVLLSCYTQRVGFTELTRGFSDPLEIATFYNRALSLWLRQCSRLKLHCIDVRYEDLVQDPPAQLDRILEFLKIPPSQRILDFDPSKRRRWISTPSYDQVAQPVYSRSVSRWKNYRQWLEPAKAQLASIAEMLEYELQ